MKVDHFAYRFQCALGNLDVGFFKERVNVVKNLHDDRVNRFIDVCRLRPDFFKNCLCNAKTFN